MPTIVSHLWFEKDAHQAVALYVSLVPGSAIISHSTLPAETPSGPPGSVEIIEFRLGDQHFVALQAGPLDAFNHSFSIQVRCETQAEIDHIWDGLLADGGTTEQCGWLRDRWGLCWQITPRMLAEIAADSDRARAKRVTEAMLKMVKLDIAVLERAYRGEG
jgi:predicted 3-demethylubiquinone-9 3-methyltransferase (glyoxalase superfamily)